MTDRLRDIAPIAALLLSLLGIAVSVGVAYAQIAELNRRVGIIEMEERESSMIARQNGERLARIEERIIYLTERLR